ncbi:hypothetical protein [Propionivibrio sp.]|uniref:hypothetical protein n=1 Tax=Propionivibrio sp. TaxID=2212460 RepID=UPI003BF10D5D
MIFFTSRFIPERFAGVTRGPVICIRPEYKADSGLLAHEETHVKQWLRTCGMHSIIYLCSKRYRLAAEVEAYQAQAKCYSDDRMPKFALFLASNYSLDITAEYALMRLRCDRGGV